MHQRVLFAVSGHGFGHLGQTAPVISALQRTRPDLEIIIRTRLPAFKLREKLGDRLRIQPADVDVGIVQKDALRIDLDETASQYAKLHARWESLLQKEQAELRLVAPDLVIANIPYLTLAAAQQLGIPTIAFCSLNWAEIYQHLFGQRAEAQPILRQMLDAYNQAGCFLQPAPAMPMPGITNGIPIGPVAEIGRDVSEKLRARLKADESVRVVLVSLGGMELQTACENWPRFAGLRFLVPASWHSRHPDTATIEALEYPFTDLLRSCDVLIAKPGYGSFVEAACSGTPVLYLPRRQWPEATILIDWLSEQGTCRPISATEFQAGYLEGYVQGVVSASNHRAVDPTGIGEALQTICRCLVRCGTKGSLPIGKLK